MNVAALAKVECGTEPAIGKYQCTAEGCVNFTEGHYCAWHTATCESCGDEVERGTETRGLCDRCAARNCEYDREEVLMDCWCGCARHAGVR